MGVGSAPWHSKVRKSESRGRALDFAVDDWESLEQNDGENWGNYVFDHGNVGLTFWDSKNFAPKVECKDQILRTFEQILVLKFKTKCITRVNPQAIPPC
jgi:hypothetical protein